MSVQASISQVEARVASIESRLGVHRGQAMGAGTASGADFASVLGAAGTAQTSFGATGSSVPKAQLDSAGQDYVGIPYVWGGTNPYTVLASPDLPQHLLPRFRV